MIAALIALPLALSIQPVPPAEQEVDPLKGRDAIAGLVEDARASVASPERVPLEAPEAELQLPFVAVQMEGLRVLSTSGIDDADEVARLMVATRALLATLTGKSGSFPYGCTVYLLREGERDAFLSRHPHVDASTRGWMEKLEGAGVPGTADWAFWVSSPDKRREWAVRFALDWLVRDGFGIRNEAHPWLHESLGLYLAGALVGTRSTWFVQPTRGTSTEALWGRMNEPFRHWLDLAVPLFGKDERFDLEDVLHLKAAEFDPRDHLRAYSLLAHELETRRETLPDLLARVGADEDPRKVLEELSGRSLVGLRKDVAAWLEERSLALARAEGRYTDEELLALWKPLGSSRKQAALADFEERLARLDTGQMRRLRGLLEQAPRKIPEVERTLPFFDPKTHAPAQPIGRKRLRASDSRVKRLLSAMDSAPGPRPDPREYDYDWGEHRVVRNPDTSRTPDDVFQDALLGVPPGADLARAVLLSILDREDEREQHDAFAHAYTDRDGNVYPFSLYQVWTSGIEKEMPDVDTLGLVHVLLGDWNRWVAPVPDTQHAALYGLLDQQCKQVQRSRQLRELVAEEFLRPDPIPPPGYESLLLNLHAQWTLVEDDPGRMALSLPPGRDRDPFLEALTRRCLDEPGLYDRGRARSAALAGDVIALRRELAAALQR